MNVSDPGSYYECISRMTRVHYYFVKSYNTSASQTQSYLCTSQCTMSVRWYMIYCILIKRASGIANNYCCTILPSAQLVARGYGCVEDLHTNSTEQPEVGQVCDIHTHHPANS